MAAPNLASLTTITGKTAAVTLSTTNATTILSNASGSNKVFKINSLFVANIDGTNNVDITVSYYTGANLGGTAFRLTSTILVPADATLIVIGKDTQIYLEENTSIGATASAASDATIVCSYEDIS